ncbi:MAG: hypothetical protein IJS28_00385 [Synergistaceae bacterium]|nr:hypothetical protein [Synergistaceae bacterium]
MARSISSERIKRLNSLLKVMRECGYVSRDELIEKCGYVSSRTLESDIRFMKEAFGAKIHYSRSRKGYVLENTGEFILYDIERSQN